MTEPIRRDRVQVASYLLTGFILLLVLWRDLLAALFSGLLVFSLVRMLAPALGKSISDHRARVLAVAVLSGAIVALLTAGIWGAASFFGSEAGNPQTIMQRLADIIEASRGQLPPWIMDHVPASAEALRAMLTGWLREHAAQAQTLGQQAGRTIAHILIGMVIGAIAALRDATSPHHYKPLAAALYARVVNLHRAFRNIVFAQVRIAALNAVFTAIYLMLVLPMAGVNLPLKKSMVAITFVAGLLPVIGNLISNTVVVIVGLSHSLQVALASLLFLVVIHKLEYFLNARIIGSHINARAWELLGAMLLMEAVFGLHGVVAAPVFYAYLKQELMDRDLV
ncbi:Predicted PurR-regulated permease PerM [Noviherbaspirillum humi]|uniref:Predicted PurR-regulated permease PerM n=1 Tax=Noviherbaspirillum humi TaxID=1688639 RepID=A0A239C5W0_9BURK|nr:hypothetical protein [Noviherbaspirillum humi]SNS15048.1 Predicted PurR-regulated permease PerM [Noviherbaspirillum humi]